MDDIFMALALMWWNRVTGVIALIVLVLLAAGFVGWNRGVSATYDAAHERGFVEWCEGTRVWKGECE